MALGRHGGDAQGTHVVADVSGFAGTVRDIDIVVEDTHGKRGLGQFAVSHKTVGLEALVLGWAHAGEVNRVLCAPVVLL